VLGTNYTLQPTHSCFQLLSHIVATGLVCAIKRLCLTQTESPCQRLSRTLAAQRCSVWAGHQGCIVYQPCTHNLCQVSSHHPKKKHVKQAAKYDGGHPRLQPQGSRMHQQLQGNPVTVCPTHSTNAACAHGIVQKQYRNFPIARACWYTTRCFHATIRNQCVSTHVAIAIDNVAIGL
jgi:hypothetical protein